ncbi:hypothetical protein [Mesorhizobium sp. A623]
MAVSPQLRELVAAAGAKYQGASEPACGIIPLQPVEIDPRGALIYDVADIISEALTGPAIHVMELAEMIVDTVQEAA